ncbi:MAG: DUF58 domain-containing protein [Candidatus Krumholzibacteriota bacterium]|nr:DUF58 domain-containing protein [Candidatus Krumholzibacteriota bacterium]
MPSIRPRGVPLWISSGRTVYITHRHRAFKEDTLAYLKRQQHVSPYLDPAVVSKLGNMDLKARLIVEGYIAGLHRSPYHGFSVEFAEYRQYMQGDSIKTIDWKVYGKTDRSYVKVFEEETNLIANILLDKSGSMGFPTEEDIRERFREDERRGREHGHHIDKLTYGCLLAASLAYLMIRQQDAVGLLLFDDRVRTMIPHRSVRKQLFHILHNLESITPGERTSISPTLHEMAERMKRRGLVIIISDLMDDPDELIMGLKHFRHRQHEVIVFHVLDPYEIDLDYRDEVEFEDLESGRRIRLEPAFLREQYNSDVAAWIDRLERSCRNHQIDYNLLRTDMPFDQALTAYLGKRLRLG